jgi:hypothetical protein
MLYGKELAQSIQKRCKIQPGMLVKSTAGTTVSKIALVVGLVQEKYDLSYIIDQDKLPERVKIYPACVQFNELEDIMTCENNTIMLFPNEAEVLS